MAGATLEGTDKGPALPPPPGATVVRPAGKQSRQPAPSGTHGPPLVPPLPALPYSGSWLHNSVQWGVWQHCLWLDLMLVVVCTHFGVRAGVD